MNCPLFHFDFIPRRFSAIVTVAVQNLSTVVASAHCTLLVLEIRAIFGWIGAGPRGTYFQVKSLMPEGTGSEMSNGAVHRESEDPVL
jgi:hypothetical protein